MAPVTNRFVASSMYRRNKTYELKTIVFAGILRTGQSLRLDCRVSAEDRISISWTLDGEMVLNTSRRYQDPLTGDLIIRRADRRLDTGSFSCSATNISSGFSIVSQPAVVTVLCKLLLRKSPLDYQKRRGISTAGTA